MLQILPICRRIGYQLRLTAKNFMTTKKLLVVHLYGITAVMRNGVTA